MRYFVAFVLFFTITNGLPDIIDNLTDKVVSNEGPEEGTETSIGPFKEPINSATKLLYDLDVEVQQMFPSENPISSDEIGTQQPTTTEEPKTAEPQIYSAMNSDFELALSKQGESVSALVTQLDTLQRRIEDTIQVLSGRRQYILSAMLRPMMNSVRRIRSNVVRIQTQLTSIQTAASNIGSRPGTQPLGAADQTAIDNIRKRVDELQKRIGDIMGRITSSLNIPGASSSQNASRPPASGR